MEKSYWLEYMAIGVLLGFNIVTSFIDSNDKPTFRTEVRQRLERIERKLDDLTTNATGS